MATHQPTGAELLDAQGAARHLDVEPDTLNQWRFHKRGPAYIKIGRNVRYRLSDLEAWLDSHRVEHREGA